ncbi:MAG: thymidine kinase [Crocinitomicaceae bacterium]|nr:thymidine kinase [Crocinitomicaceae bacterium]MDG1775787.1 thymidine kinase [Crocinitomicaceae bacterium]
MSLEHVPGEVKNQGWIEVICGSMFSGKTEELIRRLRRAEFAKQNILLIKPKVDSRYHKENVVSHQGNSFDAVCVNNALEIPKIWTNEKIVAIDEAQFFDDTLVAVCTELASKGVRIILAGLDMDFKGIPFGPMPQLLCIAEYVSKVHAICVSCGNLAQFSHRTVNVNEQVLLGAVEEYKPLCRACYTKIET